MAWTTQSKYASQIPSPRIFPKPTRPGAPKPHYSSSSGFGTAQIKTTGDEVMELVSMVNQKIAKWEERSLQGAASLGKDIRTLVLNFSLNLATGHPAKAENHQPPPSKHNGYAEAAGALPSAPKAPPKVPKSPYKSPLPEKPPRIFLRLPEDHPARRASPHYGYTEETPGQDLLYSCERNPTGAFWPSNLARDGLGLHLLTGRKEALENCIQGAKAEVEQNWAIFALPNAPQEYTSYDRTQVPTTEHMALEEFKLQM
ncbi:hypothetical protein SI65_03919 [Aspergillus cristatus]|uniref:Uncharacterized protein n=1 Tax=Aspergillus cristatus TaxID=573508 RepID=A0A1E3BKI5_ASPCR|nr:hypothetical protein SI65_03919 [Aspergillus cristatus]